MGGHVETLYWIFKSRAGQLTPIQRKEISKEIREKLCDGRMCEIFGGARMNDSWQEIADHLDMLNTVPEEEMPSAEEIELIRKHRILEAIKALRRRTTLGLYEAKQMTEKWRADPKKYGLA